MRLWLKGSVTIPRRPSTVGGIIGWSRGVNRALQELRDRKIEGAVANSRGGGSHPWKATPNGDNTVKIAQGFAMNWGTSGDIAAGFDADFVEFTGADVTVTGAGTIMARINASESAPGLYWFNANSITVGLNPAITADEIHIPICTVTLTDGIAAVTKQFLRQDISMPM